MVEEDSRQTITHTSNPEQGITSHKQKVRLIYQYV